MNWTARLILKDIADSDRRRRVAAAFWRYAEPSARALAIAHLAKALHFRDDSLRKLPAEKKAELLASRMTIPELEQPLEMALMQYHTHEANTMLGAFLDQWKIPHVNGSIEVDEYEVPSSSQVRDAVTALDTYDRRDVLMYLASAGLLMGEEWRAATWPVVDDLSSRVSQRAP
jgi:hypothetical protein